MAADPWKSLNFKIGAPFYYYDDYASTTDAAGLSRFQARASASLNEALDSVFIINGYSEGSGSAVIDISDETPPSSTASCPTEDPV